MTQATPDLLVLSYGPDLAAAQALALACNLDTPVPAYDAGLLDLALEGGRRCVVVWSDPQAALAAALRDGTPPARIAADWTAFADSLLARIGQAGLAPNALTVIDAGAIRGQAGALHLGPTLPLVRAMPGTATPTVQDTAALLAQLMLPHLPDLHTAWHRLRDASLPATLTPVIAADLDTLAEHGRALDRALRERDLLRDQLQALAALKASSPAPNEASDRKSSEIALLRAQLLSLAELAAGSVLTAAASQGGQSADQFAEIDLLRAQLLAIATLLQGPDDSGAAHPAPAPSDEVRLLRAHLAYLQSDLGLGGAVPTALPDTPPPAGFETAIARLLSDLVQETDRRIQAERDATAARKALRHLGIEAPTLPGRTPVAPRPPG